MPLFHEVTTRIDILVSFEHTLILSLKNITSTQLFFGRNKMPLFDMPTFRGWFHWPPILEDQVSQPYPNISAICHHILFSLSHLILIVVENFLFYLVGHSDECITDIEQMCVFTQPPQLQAECDTMLIFKLSTVGLNSFPSPRLVA